MLPAYQSTHARVLAAARLKDSAVQGPLTPPSRKRKVLLQEPAAPLALLHSNAAGEHEWHLWHSLQC